MSCKKYIALSIIAASTLISGCKLVQPEPVACWAPETKEAIPKLAKRILVNTIAVQYDEAGKPRGEREVTDADIAKISEGLSIETSLYHLESINTDADVSACGANIKATFKLSSGKVVTLPEQSFNFSIYPAEQMQKVYSVHNGNWADAMVKSAK